MKTGHRMTAKAMEVVYILGILEKPDHSRFQQWVPAEIADYMARKARDLPWYVPLSAKELADTTLPSLRSKGLVTWYPVPPKGPNACLTEKGRDVFEMCFGTSVDPVNPFTQTFGADWKHELALRYLRGVDTPKGTRDIASFLGASINIINDAMMRAAKEGKVDVIGQGRGTQYRAMPKTIPFSAADSDLDDVVNGIPDPKPGIHPTPEALKSLLREVCQKYCCIPTKIFPKSSTLHLAIVDDRNVSAVDEIRFITRLKDIILDKAPEADILKAIETYYPLPTPTNGNGNGNINGLSDKIIPTEPGMDAEKVAAPADKPADKPKGKIIPVTPKPTKTDGDDLELTLKFLITPEAYEMLAAQAAWDKVSIREEVKRHLEKSIRNRHAQMGSF